MAGSNFIKSIYPLSGTVSNKNLKVEFYDNPGRKSRKAAVRINVSNGSSSVVIVKQAGQGETLKASGDTNKSISNSETSVSFTLVSNSKQLRVFSDGNDNFTMLLCNGNQFSKNDTEWYYTIPGDPGGVSGDQIYTITVEGITPNYDSTTVRTNTLRIYSYTGKLSIPFVYVQDSVTVTKELVIVSPTYLSFESGTTSGSTSGDTSGGTASIIRLQSINGGLFNGSYIYIGYDDLEGETFSLIALATTGYKYDIADYSPSISGDADFNQYFTATMSLVGNASGNTLTIQPKSVNNSYAYNGELSGSFIIHTTVGDSDTYYVRQAPYGYARKHTPYYFLSTSTYLNLPASADYSFPIIGPEAGYVFYITSKLKLDESGNTVNSFKSGVYYEYASIPENTTFTYQWDESIDGRFDIEYKDDVFVITPKSANTTGDIISGYCYITMSVSPEVPSIIKVIQSSGDTEDTHFHRTVCNGNSYEKTIHIYTYNYETFCISNGSITTKEEISEGADLYEYIEFYSGDTKLDKDTTYNLQDNGEAILTAKIASYSGDVTVSHYISFTPQYYPDPENENRDEVSITLPTE